MKEPNGRIKTCFKYVDEFEDETEVIKEVAADYPGLSEVDIICSLFRDFLIACGFNSPIGKKIVFEDED